MNPVSCIEKHDISHRQRNPETGRWIFHTDQYMAWDKSERAFLWLNGQREFYYICLFLQVADACNSWKWKDNPCVSIDLSGEFLECSG
jgi:hypothetical protein